MAKNNKDCATLKYRVEQLEKNYIDLNEKMDQVLENHLPHINIELQSLSTKITVATVLNIGTIILGAVLLKFL